MKLASGLARNATATATSSTRPIRPTGFGTRFFTACRSISAHSSPQREVAQHYRSLAALCIDQALREMEEHGVVHREVFKEVPPRVEYTATKLGFSLEPVIKSLCAWGRRHAVELNQLDLLDECKPPNDAREDAR